MVHTVGVDVLKDTGQRAVRVPPKLLVGARDRARTRSESDPIDAPAIARAAPREPDLPVAEHDQASRELELLVDRRADLVAERIRMIDRLRWHLHELDPETTTGTRQVASRLLDVALHRIAATQLRLPDSLGRAYYQRRRAGGDTTTEALRALKRRLARVVFNLLITPDTATAAPQPAAA